MKQEVYIKVPVEQELRPLLKLHYCNAVTLYSMRSKMPNRTNRNRYPLKKVVGSVPGKAWRIILECGHEVNAASDIYGQTSPVRQRCRLCFNNMNSIQTNQP